MPSVVEYLNREKRKIDKIVDQTFFRLLEGTAPIDALMPRTSYVDRSLLILKMKNHRPTVASLVAEEQEIPASRPRAQMTEDLLGNCKLGKQIIWLARDFEMMQKMAMMASAMGDLGTQVVDGLKKHYFGAVADLVPAINEKALVLTMRVATGQVATFTDPITGAKFTLNYPDIIPAHLPTPLTGAARWSQAATATPLKNLEDHAQIIYDNLGMWMPTLVLHFNTLRQIANTNEAKTAKLAKMGSNTASTDLASVYLSDQEVIDLIIERTRCTSVEIFDAQYSEENSAGDVTDKYYLEENWYFFGSPGFLEQAFVPTVEKDFAPGLYQNSRVLNDAPRQERTVAVGNMIPLAADPRRLAARKVA
jgi:hypothetical protein